MTDERQAEGETSLRDLLRAIERAEKEHMPLPMGGASMEDVKSSIPVMPVFSRLGDTPEAAAAPAQFFEPAFTSARWWDRVGMNATAAAAFSVGMVAPAAVVVLAGSMVMAPSPSADWAVGSLDKVQFNRAGNPEVTGSLKSADVHQAGFLRIEGFTNLWQKLGNGEAPKLAPRLSTKLTIEAAPGLTVAMPIAIEGADANLADLQLVVRGVPEFASLTGAQPQPDGTWIVAASAAQDVMVTAYAKSSHDHELQIELRSTDGTVLASATTVLQPAADQLPANVAKAEPTTQAPVSAPPARAAQPARERASASVAVVPDTAKPAAPQKRTVAANETRQRARAERKISTNGQMRAGLAGVQPVPKTPRIVIVDGPLPTRIGDPMPLVVAPPVQRPAPVAVEQSEPVPQQTQVWREPWARAAFATSQ